MSAIMIKEQLINEINLMPLNKLSEVFNFLHSYRLGVESSSSDVAESWESEINDRLSAVKSGELKGVDYDTAMQSLNKEFPNYEKHEITRKF